MSVIYDFKTKMLYTGAHDGTLFGWHYESSSIKYRLDEKDSSMFVLESDGVTIDQMASIKEQKSIDVLIIMENQRLLLSGTADQHIRFWDLDVMPDKPLDTLNCILGKGESLTCM